MLRLEFGKSVKVFIMLKGNGIYFFSKSGGIGKTRLLSLVDSSIDLGYNFYTSTYLHGRRITNGNLDKSKLCIYDRVDLYNGAELRQSVKEIEKIGSRAVVLIDSKNNIGNLFKNSNNVLMSNVTLNSGLNSIEVIANDIIRG